ncbi:Glycosyl hydrolase superfamily protein [Zea mays]|uniref:Glycosyl hydrolase superfamily protein n=1 Tax=Zea mays TaxID=4577 RepID=A0A1D6MEM2_MAIZE|nr:Glycosyl hydrolase superfamily protein [Zea mays]
MGASAAALARGQCGSGLCYHLAIFCFFMWQSSPPMDLEKSVPRVDPFGGVDVTLREGKLEVLAEATSALFHTDAKNKRKGVWIEIDSGGDDDQSERSSAVASEGSTVTAATSAVSTATSGRCR